MSRDGKPHLWLEYRVELLKFAGGGRMDFTRRSNPKMPRFLFNDDDRIAAIDNLGVPVVELDRMIAPFMDVEILEIDYRVCTQGFACTYFYHPQMRGHHVFLLPRIAGDKTLRMRQAQGRRFFSHNYTLDDITKGKVPSDQRVWQFMDNV